MHHCQAAMMKFRKMEELAREMGGKSLLFSPW
jgi:hypothetical protein